MDLKIKVINILNSGFVKMSGLQTITKGIGLLREILIARYFGISQYADAYVIGQNLFNLFSPLISDASQTAGTPMLSRVHGQSRMSHAHVVSILVSWAALTAILFAMIVAFFSKPLLNFITPGLTLEVQEIVQQYIWLLFPYAVIFAVSGAFTASINSQERFGLSELGNLLINIASVVTLIVIHRVSPSIALPLSLSLGFVAGGVYFIRIVKPRFTLDLFNEVALSMSKVLPAVMIGYGLIQANTIVDRYFTSTLPVGSFAAINYANKIIFLPLGIIGASINTIAFVKFSKIENRQIARTALLKAVLAMVLGLLPFTIILAIFPSDIVRLLFGGGAFSSQAVELTSDALRVLSFALIPLGLAGTLQKKLYADKNPTAVLKGTFVAVILGITVNILAVPKYGIQGLMLAVLVSNLGLILYLFYEIFKKDNRDKP